MYFHLFHKWHFVKEYGIMQNKYKFVCSCGKVRHLDNEED